MGTLLEHLDICLKLKFEHNFSDHTPASLNKPNTSSFSSRLVLILYDNPWLLGAEETDDLRLEEWAIILISVNRKAFLSVKLVTLNVRNNLKWKRI